MSDFADLLKGISAALWVVLAFIVFLALRRGLGDRLPFLSKLGLSPTGVSMEFAEAKLAEAASQYDAETARSVGEVTTRTVFNRLQRNADLLRGCRILWVDDHPDNNVAILDILRKYGALVETPLSNRDALSLLGSSRYDVILSDVGRDSEEPNGKLKGIEFAEAVFAQWSQQVVLFTARFDPTRLPDTSDHDRLELTRRVATVVFGRTNRYDEALHLILDVLERQKS
jgi:CheY-like chemotaxis protein